MEALANQLQKQNTQLLNFAHITSHNLRSHVSNLNSLLYLYNESTDEEEKDMLFNKFETVISHLTETLNNLVGVLKIQSDLNKNREFISFEKVLNKTKEILAGQILQNNAVITHDFSEAENIEFPLDYLESILLNLCSNAIKYRLKDRSPKIHLQTEKCDRQISLKVSDNGLGIDLIKYKDYLFGLNKTFHRHPDAKGVGLFITKTQVEAMGDTISAESEVGSGTTFTIIFNQHKNSNHE